MICPWCKTNTDDVTNHRSILTIKRIENDTTMVGITSIDEILEIVCEVLSRGQLQNIQVNVKFV